MLRRFFAAHETPAKKWLGWNPEQVPRQRDASKDRHDLGRRSEQLAQRWLARQGYTIERTNVRFPVGELDIVAREGNALCFVEVRATSSSAWGGALATITDRKRRRLIRAARWYLAHLRQGFGGQAREHALPEEIRFDVVAIEWSEPPKLELIRHAFSVDDR